MTNPFNTGSRIKDPAYFIGRIRESEEIFAKIQNSNCVSVVGERRIGKSSLLYYVCETGKKHYAERRLAYLDFMDVELKTAEGFTELLLASLNIEFDEVELQRNPNVLLTRALRRFSLSNPTPVVFLDEFDNVQRLPDFFNDHFLENLRSVCDAGYLCVVTASKTPLKDLIDKAGLTSPFWNIFTHLPLGEFAIDEHLDERQDFLWHYWRNLEPSDSEMRFLLSYTSTHPLVMQIVSFNVLQNRQFPLTGDELRRKIEREINSHFRGTGDVVKRWLYIEQKKLPEKIDWTSEHLNNILRGLIPLTGI